MNPLFSFWVLTLALALAPAHVFGEKEKILELETAKHYQITIEEDIYGIFRDGDKIFSFPGRKPFYIKSNYNAAAKEPDLGFGSLKSPIDSSERMPFEVPESPKRIRTLLAWKDWWLFIDSEKRNALVWNKKQERWQRSADLLLDTARPAPDSQGEATRREVEGLTAFLRKALSREKENSELLGGIAPMPSRWKDRDGSQFLIWLRLPEAPLLTLHCDAQQASVCQVKRVCYLSGLGKDAIRAMTGLSLDAKSDRLIIGNPLNQTLYELKGKGCYSVQAKPLLKYSKDLLELSGIHIDENQNMWLSTSRPDLKFSASIFVWDAQQWLP